MKHRTLRQFLGHSGWCDEERYGLQRLRDNLRLFTPEILDRINTSRGPGRPCPAKKKPNGRRHP